MKYYSNSLYGKRVTLVPLPASEVYRLLREAGREDAVPEGRVVTQGIAAVSGFALGLAKGIGGSLLVDLAANLLATNGQNVTGETEEVCFSSRSLNEIDDGDDDEHAEGRQNDDDAIISADYSDYDNSNPVRSEASSPSATNAGIDYGDDEDINAGDDIRSRTITTTQTSPGDSINCVLIKQ
ncbi:PREDICTED: uncharacterized protein LOC108974492 isoform X2 [Bactrocera latifrons]|uniref:Uncharacterized protein n=1 Tax=Bactrocera latifrons TaxID=174628 RepID=A0A0K8VTR9_BACLA|nr:PREDICTED: uncharacterized protein LOC108974492 isoform X2 [Bactrocera latifrons]